MCFFVAKLGPDSVAVVGLTDSLLTLVFAVAMGLSMATTAMVALRIGEKDSERAADTAAQALFLGCAVAVGTGFLGCLMADRLLGIMGASAAMVETGMGFTRIMLGGNVTVMLLFLINAIFRGAGDAAIAMRALWLANLVNIVLDPILIFRWSFFP